MWLRFPAYLGILIEQWLGVSFIRIACIDCQARWPVSSVSTPPTCDSWTSWRLTGLDYRHDHPVSSTFMVRSYSRHRTIEHLLMRQLYVQIYFRTSQHRLSIGVSSTQTSSRRNSSAPPKSKSSRLRLRRERVWVAALLRGEAGYMLTERCVFKLEDAARYIT